MDNNEHRRTKLALARMFFAESHALHQDYFKAHGIRFATSIELSIVGRAVFLGYAEDKPMGLAQLERFLEMPRATLRRRLRDLMALGYIERQGNVYVVRTEALNSPEMHRSIERARNLLFETYTTLHKKQPIAAPHQESSLISAAILTAPPTTMTPPDS